MFDIATTIKQVKNSFSRNGWLILSIIVLLYLLTRLVNLDQFPIFSDEGIYIRWAKVAWHDATWRFISLTDGRQPLQTWATIPFLKLFENNALLAGRLFATTSGFITLVGAVVTARYLFSEKVALIVGFLYVFTPYFLFYDRIALVDSAVNASTMWIFLLSIVLARTRRLDVALILGFVAGFALLAKSSIRLYIGLASLASLFIILPGKLTFFEEIKNHFKKKEGRPLLSFFFLYLLVVAMAGLIYNVQRLSPFMHYVEEKNKTFILTRQELFADPFNYFSHNIVNLPYYIFAETGYLVAVIGIIGLFFMYKKHRNEALYFTAWLVPAIVAISLVARVLFPRYVLSLGGLLIIPAAYALATISKKTHLYAALVFLFFAVSYFNYTILFDYAKIPFPQIDRGQYLEGWPAGWGAKEIIEYTRAASTQEKPALIIAEGNFGMSHDVLDTFLRPDDTIKIQPYWPLDKEQLIENQKNIATNNVFVVFAHRREYPADWPLELIQKYDKPGDESEMYLFRLLPAGAAAK